MFLSKFRSPLVFLPTLALLFGAIAAFMIYQHLHPHLSAEQAQAWEQVFLKRHYGKFDKRHSAWRGGKAGSDGVPKYWMHVCLDMPTSVKDEPHVLLALCGLPGHDSGEEAEQTRHDFYVLKPDAEQQSLVIAAQWVGYLAGDFGRPADVKALRLGHDFYAFDLNWNRSGQEGSHAMRALLVAQSKHLVEAARFHSQLEVCSATDAPASADSASNSGASDSCSRVKFELNIDDSVPDSPIYPASVHETGTTGISTVDTVYSLHFNTRTATYSVPPEVAGDD